MAGSAMTPPTPTPTSSPSLTERRKAATRLDIARAAAELFTRDGLRATRAEDIARAAGVAPRTFYRYFATKEESVAPLLDAGAHQWAEAVREAPAHLPVPAALRHAVERALDGDDPANAASLGWVRALLRLTEESPALRAVWSDTCRVSESTLLTILAERTDAGPDPDLPLRLLAGMATTAVRVAVETWARSEAPPTGSGGPAALALECLTQSGLAATSSVAATSSASNPSSPAGTSSASDTSSPAGTSSATGNSSPALGREPAGSGAEPRVVNPGGPNPNGDVIQREPK
ncbi:MULTISPECIES: TetR family transcriptional regulator [unclassified Streptomyces]|uniref:TetR/AcrR family transcriptional regulator n=1 Tax=unclassified Streptomyces TaxID=2593676 RepID=UPI002E17801F|nr:MULTISPECIES: TetR family transcriptional regulator [unclassified Streptomyces]